MVILSAASILAASFAIPLVLAYDLVREYRGIPFFDTWDFYGNYDNLTQGDVVWVDRDTAYGSHLAYVNAAGNAILKVDNAAFVEPGQKRNSVRLATQDSFGMGSLWIADFVHLPYGCSVWPAWWTTGPTWPDNGEIDIIEQINLEPSNQMALHSLPGCFQSVPAYQTGLVGGDRHLGSDCSTSSGCVVKENSPNSFGAGFAAAGGGVYAAQFDIKGVFIWFWSRPNVPAAVTSAIASGTAPMDLSTWGPPSAAYMATGCDITEFFSPQHMILDITLCGNWAGLPDIYGPQCGAAGPTGRCYDDMVVGDGSKFDDAYFEIAYMRAYTTGGPVPMPTPAQVGAVWDAATASAASTTVTAWPTDNGAPPRPNAADAATPPSRGWIAALPVLVALGGAFGAGWVTQLAAW